MSSSRLRRLVGDAWQNNDVQAARDAYNEYLVSHCLHPQRLLISDSHTQTQRYIDVACGRCYHCMESKINEWTTRMYAHAEDFKNVYFVTLTYRSITDPLLPVNKLLLSKLVQAVWHRDAYNETKHYSYSPCLLVKKHYQDFLKRLRKNTGLKDLTYVISGETGSKYGRPHFHAIFFTNGVLTKRDIERAWSVCLWRSNSGDWSFRTSQKKDGTAYDFPIGRVDFHDLVLNGTFNTTAKIRVDGTYMNAANCFSYVCKYVVKRDKANLSRLNLAYRNLYHKEQFVKCFDNEVSYDLAYQWLLDHGYNIMAATNLYNNQLNNLKYEKTIYQPSETIYVDGLCRSREREIQNYRFTEEVLPTYYYDFRERFSPFCEFSRATPIGSVYAKRNIQEFTEGVFTKPLLQESGYVVPRYFTTKARQYVYGLRSIHKTISGNSFVFAGLQDLAGHFDAAIKNNDYTHFDFRRAKNLPTIAKTLPLECKFVDVYTSERICFLHGFARHYKYDRHERAYSLSRCVPLPEFIRNWCARLQLEFKSYADATRISKQNLRDSDAALCILTDLGQDVSHLNRNFEENSTHQRKHMQHIYHELHNSAE